MSNTSQIEKKLYKFLFEQNVSLASALNDTSIDANKLSSNTIDIRNTMASWVSAIDRKELVLKLKIFLLDYKSVDVIKISGSWEYRGTDATYSYTPNYSIYFHEDNLGGLIESDLEEELIYDLELFVNFSDYETEEIISHLAEVSLGNVDSLFELITAKEDMKTFLAVENYEKNEIQNVIASIEASKISDKKQKI